MVGKKCLLHSICPVARETFIPSLLCEARLDKVWNNVELSSDWLANDPMALYHTCEAAACCQILSSREGLLAAEDGRKRHVFVFLSACNFGCSTLEFLSCFF